MVVFANNSTYMGVIYGGIIVMGSHGQDRRPYMKNN
jgi:hypothetical protein